MKATLFALRFNELLDDAPHFRRERTTHVVSLASAFNIERIRRVKPFNLHRHSRARAATQNVARFKLSPAAQHLTPELTGARASIQHALKINDESHAVERPVE